MTDTETTSQIPDPENPSSGKIGVRVLFNIEQFESFRDVFVYGLFRLDSDAEIDFKSLSKDTQNNIVKACERETKT